MAEAVDAKHGRLRRTWLTIFYSHQGRTFGAPGLTAGRNRENGRGQPEERRAAGGPP